MTPFTSFVAVDQVKRADGKIETVKQPLPLPQGVSDLAVGGAAPVAHSLLKMMPGSPLGMLAARPRADRHALEADPIPRPTGKAVQPVIHFNVRVLKATGGLEAEGLKATLSTGLTGWREQYEKKMRQGSTLPNELSVSFNLDNQGRIVGQPAVEKALQDQDLRKNLIETIKGLQFAVPREGSGAVTVKLILP